MRLCLRTSAATPTTFLMAAATLLLAMAIGRAAGPQTAPIAQPSKVGDTWANASGMTFAYVPAGTFLMGSPAGEPGAAPQERQHGVRITRPFLLGRTLVTVAQFTAFVTDAGYKTEAERRGWGIAWNGSAFRRVEGASWRNPGFKQGPDHPVIEVSWNDAVAFNDWLGRREGKRYRLPTEAEWEYACRAGTTTPYFWGQRDDGKGWLNGPDLALKRTLPGYRLSTFNWDDGYPFTSPVGAFRANAWGLYDMAGNAWEWCDDFYADDYGAQADDPKGPPAGQVPSRANPTWGYRGPLRVIRGGAYNGLPAFCRSASRRGEVPVNSMYDGGFRVALSLDDAPAVAIGPVPAVPAVAVPPQPLAVPRPTFAEVEGLKRQPAAQQPASAPAGQPDRPRAVCTLVAQIGQPSWANAVSFSPDGKQVLTGGNDNTARLWDTASGRELRRFVGHTAAVLSVCFSPDGKEIFTGSADKTARLWDAATGQLLRLVNTQQGWVGEVTFVGFGDEGKQWLTRGNDTVVVWDAGTGTKLSRLDAFGELCLSPDGRRVLSNSLALRNTPHIVDIETKRELQVFRGHTDEVNCACMSRDGKQVVTGSKDGTARLWDAATGVELNRYACSSPVDDVSLSLDGKRILTAGPTDVTRVWDAVSGKELQRLPVSMTWVAGANAAQFSPDGTQVLIAASDNSVQLFDALTGTRIRQLDGHAKPVRSVCFSDDSNRILCGGDDGAAHLWDVATGTQFRWFAGAKAIDAVAISPDGKWVVTAGGGADTILWDVATGKYLSRLTTTPSDCVSFSPDGERVVTGGLRGGARIYGTATGQLLGQFRAGTNAMCYAAYTADQKQILAADSDVARLFEVGSGKLLGTFGVQDVSEYVRSACVSPNATRVLTGGKSTRLWDAATAKEVQKFEGHTGPVNSVTFSPDGGQVATGSNDLTARLWDAATGKELRRLEGHTGGVNSICYSRDGKHLLTGSNDGTTAIWNAATGEVLCRLVSFDDGTWAVVAPDGRYDAPNGGEAKWLQWVFADNPFRPVGIDVLLRDYYEPHLLTRVLANNGTVGGDFRPVRPLQDIDREQPLVGPVTVQRSGQSDCVDVVVSARGTAGNVLRDGKRLPLDTMHDLRLFRDGALIAQSPAAEDTAVSNGLSDKDLAAWDLATRVAFDPAGTVTFRNVPLPHRAGARVEFTAYAFNADRVKSDTAHATFAVPSDLPPRKPRAYVLAMGVDQSQSPDFNLQFAAADAALIHDELAPRLVGYDVVRVLLASTAQHPDEADKANLRAVLQVLAGEVPDKAVSAKLPSECQKLARATPDDLVLLSFSGHGLVSGGEFYLLPSDIGPGQSKSREPPNALLSRCVSTEELSRWLRHVDAGQMALIIDACHSAATVQQADFKPGPLGNRGLGQLAYDKRMRVLAASQSNSEAIESLKVQHGLLTYALVRDGLIARQAANNNKLVSLGQAMNYAAQRVPGLYLEMVHDKVDNFGLGDGPRGMLGAGGSATASQDDSSKAQHPALFDFADPSRDAKIQTGG